MVPTDPRPVVTLRQATRADVPRLVEMNHAAYPELVEQNVVWSAAQLEAHLDRFPEGQLVAELLDETGDHPRSEPGAGASAPALRRRIVGAISTFVVAPPPRGRDPLAQHTWLQITDDGTFSGHDRAGDTLYLADVYVDPSAWGKGVGEALYRGLQDLCVRVGCKRVVAGGRLWGYHEYAGRLTPQEYVESALRGEIRDRVLGSQLKAGFRVRGILTGYLKDPRSGDFATLLEWTAPTPGGR